ncbi:hypothetical protein [Granulicella arctica]|uniref:Uncharacterized protein n=1 Tax=Granulicella arctica TaxID=940613 RepID=A0A7Y9PFC0_9BACT|nr:hypothetical protein [Granulicella arctica]NYF78844.1 hypothetical protein [Granulicella arctica]
MNTAPESSLPNRFSLRSLSLIASLTLLAATPLALSQNINSRPAATTLLAANTTPADTLPDSPGATLTASSSSADSSDVNNDWQFGLGSRSDKERAKHMASPTEKFILPGQLAPKLTSGNKVELGLIHGISLYSALGWVVSSGYSQIINSSPNYGVDKGAYGQRLGAAALRGYSDEVLRDSVMANVFHQDPRYYKMGPSHNIAVRTFYSVSRVLVTRGDDGRLAPNYSLVAGNAVGAALTNAYYPNFNRGFDQTAKTFGNSMYGTAFSFFASEFLSGALESIHLKESRD